MALADSAAILIIEPVEDVVAAVFDDPMATVHAKDLGWGGHFPGATGDAIGPFLSGFAGFLVIADALDQKGLANVGKVYEGVEYLGDPDASSFKSAMNGWGDFSFIRI